MNVGAPELIHQPSNRSWRRHRWSVSPGFTLLELLLVVAILGTISGLAIPFYVDYLEKAKRTRAIAEISIFAKAIDAYEKSEGTLPLTLHEVGMPIPKDPWGNPYQYLNFSTVTGKGKFRKDKFLVPLNSTFDLYSMGRDGATKPPLAARVSWDDIIRANDGGFVGLAQDF